MTKLAEELEREIAVLERAVKEKEQAASDRLTPCRPTCMHISSSLSDMLMDETNPVSIGSLQGGVRKLCFYSNLERV